MILDAVVSIDQACSAPIARLQGLKSLPDWRQSPTRAGKSVLDGRREPVQRRTGEYLPPVACWPGSGGSAQFLGPLED
jgi:hypothetical protein